MTFDKTIPINEETLSARNLADRLSSQDLLKIGGMVSEGYVRDERSRERWCRWMQSAMDLALQYQQTKNFPWAGAANVAFPLITIAALQFHSRAYPATVISPDIVNCRVLGEDPEGIDRIRAHRISKYMSYQLLDESDSWEEEQDRLLINLPVMGVVFKKTYRDSARGVNVSHLVLAKDLVVDYYAKSLEDCARITHIIPYYRNDLHEQMEMGNFSDVREETWYKSDAQPRQDVNATKQDVRLGVDVPDADSNTPYTILEQHLRVDLDGDGYAEPYIVTIEKESRQVLRMVLNIESREDIVRNQRGDIVRINGGEYFTKYEFLPSPDSGLYGLGFGRLLGPLNEATNSILNQLIDAGTLNNLGGGFLAKGARMRGGMTTFSPGEWKPVDSMGDDLRKSIVPLPLTEPSSVLFQLLNLLIDYTNRISGSTDVMVGENPGQNTKAGTMDQMVEQGMKIYSSIYKRVWRSMKHEFAKLYLLNRRYLPIKTEFLVEGQPVLREDFNGDVRRIVPSADPHISSERQQVQQATLVKQASMTTPGYDLKAVEKNFLRANRVDGWENLYLGPDKVPPLPNARFEIEKMKMEAKKMQLEFEQRKFLVDLLEQQRLNSAKISQLEAQAAKLLSEAGGVEAGHQVELFNAMVGAMKTHNQAIADQMKTMLKALDMTHVQSLMGSGESGDGNESVIDQ